MDLPRNLLPNLLWQPAPESSPEPFAPKLALRSAAEVSSRTCSRRLALSLLRRLDSGRMTPIASKMELLGCIGARYGRLVGSDECLSEKGPV